MKVTLLGTGTPTNPHRFQSGVHVQAGDHSLLFDCGRGTVHQLYQAGIPLQRLNPLFITHHHVDHINDLYDVMVSTAMRGRRQPLEIIGPPGTKAIVQALIDQVYAADIRFRVLEGRRIQRLAGAWKEEPEAIARVEVRQVVSGTAWQRETIQVYTAEVRHGAFADAPDFEWHCLGYRLQSAGKVLAISGDTVPCEGILDLARGADLLIQCCHLPDSLVNDVSTRYLTQDVLSSSRQAGEIAATAGVKRVVLTHLSATIDDGRADEVVADVQRIFGGEVLLGQDLMTLTV